MSPGNATGAPILPPYKWQGPSFPWEELELPAAGETLDKKEQRSPMVKNGSYMVSTTNYCLICIDSWGQKLFYPMPFFENKSTFVLGCL